MKFNLSLKFKIKKDSFERKKSVDKFALWQKISRIVFLCFLILATIISAFVWRKNLYDNGWTEEKKKEFIDSQSKSVTFNEKDFKKASDDFELRKKDAPGNNDSIRDIFK